MEFPTLKAKYYDMLEEAAKNKPPAVLMRKKWVDMMIQRVESAKDILSTEGLTGLPRVAMEALDTYDIVTINNEKKLVKTRVFNAGLSNQAKKIIVPLEETFEIVQKSHFYTYHGKCPKMNRWLAESNYVISMICVPVYYGVCNVCLLGETYDTDLDSNRYDTYSTLGLIFIIDMTLQPDKSFNYILVYQDLKTKYIQLRPMSVIKEPDEISMELIKLFCDFGPPDCILIPPEFKEMFKPIFFQLSHVFQPDMKLEISYVDRSSLILEIESKIFGWMKHHRCTSWAIGSQIVQWEINNTRISAQTPYEKFFGLNPGCGQEIKDIETSMAQSKNPDQDSEIRVQSKPMETEPQTLENRIQNPTETIEPNIDFESGIEISESIKVELESDDETQTKKTYICCGCKSNITTRVYFCSLCKKSLHLYCGVRRETIDKKLESVCFVCITS